MAPARCTYMYIYICVCVCVCVYSFIYIPISSLQARRAATEEKRREAERESSVWRQRAVHAEHEANESLRSADRSHAAEIASLRAAVTREQLTAAEATQVNL